jgi:glycine/D-amino acid oxidase-like deaminating enzyme
MSSGTRIVICGGGAIGAAIAYFTSRRGARSTIIERYAVAGAASGKSGGFLARDWCRGSSLDRLARRSFELHAELSAELGDPWGYRRLTTYGGYAVEDDTARGAPGRPWAGRRRRDHEPARLTGDDGAGGALRVHDRSGARR